MSGRRVSTFIRSSSSLLGKQIQELSILRYKYITIKYNNNKIYFIYNKNSILSGRHVSTFIKSSSDPLGKQIKELSIYLNIYLNIDSPWICVPREPEDDLIKVETRRPDNIIFLLYIK